MSNRAQVAALAALMVGVVLYACAPTGPGATGTTGDAAQALEWVAYHNEVPLDPDGFHALAAGLFGADAQAGRFLAEREVAPSLYLKAEGDPKAAGQSRVTLAFDDGEHPRRLLAVVPASYAVGNVFIDTVDAAVAKMKSDNQREPGSGEAFLLEYRVTSPQGGRFTLAVRGDAGTYSLAIDVATPRTSLLADRIGQPAEATQAFDTVAGTVWFHLTRDDFEFFVDRAYGKGATSRQNFKDFALVPHEWLRLTVEPHLERKFVSVGFELLTVDGRRVAIARAPASVLAGGAFQSLVSRNMALALAQEKQRPGSSTPWQIPFYYDNPDGGGVVQVIARNDRGAFTIAYAVESPRHPLVDVPFVPYLDVVIPPPDPNESASCEQLGGKPAPRGVFQVQFKASRVIINNPDRTRPLKGTLYCSIFRAKDVTITGPRDGVEAVEDFQVPDADLEAATPPSYTSLEHFAGDYQILCAQDVDGSGGASYGDPVTLPIGSYALGCDRNPVTVEFAILNPQR